jgi:hypothetical protein
MDTLHGTMKPRHGVIYTKAWEDENKAWKRREIDKYTW